MAVPVEHRAISIQRLVALTEEHGLWGKTTADVVHEFVVPNAATGESYSANLPKQDVGPVQVFASHAWSNKWGLLVESLRTLCANLPSKGSTKVSSTLVLFEFKIICFWLHEHCRTGVGRRIGHLSASGYSPAGRRPLRPPPLRGNCLCLCPRP